MTAGSETLRKEGFPAGKSETCRASEWQSHRKVAFSTTESSPTDY